jgi:hypothetical protein
MRERLSSTQMRAHAVSILNIIRFYLMRCAGGKSCGSGNAQESIFARGQNKDLRLVDRHDPKMPGQLSHYVVNWIVPCSCFRNNRSVKYRSETQVH